MKQRVKFRTCLSGYNYVIKPGQEVEMEAGEAARHVQCGNAEYCEGYPMQEPPPIETAIDNRPREGAALRPPPPANAASILKPNIRRVNK